MKYKLAALFIKYFTKLLLFTCRIRIQGQHHFTDAIARQSVILAFWHDRMALFAKTFEPYTPICHFLAVISNSRDALWLDAICKSYPNCDTLKVAHNRRSQALLAMIEKLKSPHTALMITPDGPRGPRHSLKAGVIAAAKESGCPIIPFRWKSSSSFHLPSWDRFEIPKPFSKITVQIDPAIYISQDQPLKEAQEQIEKSLNFNDL